MSNMSYCRYENTARALQDVIDALYDSDCDETLSVYEKDGLSRILDLASEIIGMEDKINNIIENQNNSLYDRNE